MKRSARATGAGGVGGAAMRLAVGAALAWTCPVALAQLVAVVPASEQAARDRDRLTILDAELQREQARLADAARRRGERLAAGDTAGSAEAEAAVARATANVASLRREVDMAKGAPAGAAVRAAKASPATAGAAATAPSASVATVTTTRAPASPPAPPAPSAAWWDAFSRPGPMAAASVGTAGAADADAESEDGAARAALAR